jgi:hypothetical protein
VALLACAMPTHIAMSELDGIPDLATTLLSPQGYTHS